MAKSTPRATDPAPAADTGTEPAEPTTTEDGEGQEDEETEEEPQAQEKPEAEEEPADDWKPKKGGQVRYCYMMANGSKRRPMAKVVKVHRGTDAGLIDLEVDIPERGPAANPVLFEKVPLYVEPPVAHAGVRPSYARP